MSDYPLDADHLSVLRPHLATLAAIWDEHAVAHLYADGRTPTLQVVPALYRPATGETRSVIALRLVLAADECAGRVWRDAGPAMARYLSAQGVEARAVITA